MFSNIITIVMFTVRRRDELNDRPISYEHMSCRSTQRTVKPSKQDMCFKLKANESCSVAKFNARWVVKGCMQSNGFKYGFKHSNEPRVYALRVVISLAVKLKLKILQMDESAAILIEIIKFFTLRSATYRVRTLRTKNEVDCYFEGTIQTRIRAS